MELNFSRYDSTIVRSRPFWLWERTELRLFDQRFHFPWKRNEVQV